LSANAASGSQINLSWGASSDNVSVTGYLLERCQGVGCSTFAQIATPTSTGYSDTGLSAATSYSYRVKARDAANNQSGYSNTASTVTQTPPGTPTSLTITATSDVEADLSWSAASNGSLSISSYRVERCQGAGCSSFSQVGTSSSTATVYYDSTLSAGTSYSYRVFAIDSGGNTGGASNTATATTINTGTSCK
jgi:fibronectin type 3 domain-containing protein